MSQDETYKSVNSTGYGQHADYVFGWEGDSLQRAMDSACYLRNCSTLTAIAPEVKNECQVKPTVVEELDACKSPLTFRITGRYFRGQHSNC